MSFFNGVENSEVFVIAIKLLIFKVDTVVIISYVPIPIIIRQIPGTVLKERLDRGLVPDLGVVVAEAAEASLSSRIGAVVD
jgi:hypothetical protein